MNIDTAKTKAMHSKYYEFSEQQFDFFNGTIKIINDIKVLKFLLPVIYNIIWDKIEFQNEFNSIELSLK